MIISSTVLSQLAKLKDALESEQINDANRIEKNLWHVVQATPFENKTALELLGAVAQTLRCGGACHLALRWYAQLCDFDGAYEPWLEDTAWDYCHYAECLLSVGNKEQAKIWANNAKGVFAMSDSTNTELRDKIERLTTA